MYYQFNNFLRSPFTFLYFISISAMLILVMHFCRKHINAETANTVHRLKLSCSCNFCCSLEHRWIHSQKFTVMATFVKPEMGILQTRKNQLTTFCSLLNHIESRWSQQNIIVRIELNWIGTPVQGRNSNNEWCPAGSSSKESTSC